ncbi:MAG: gamma-glutamyl-gamma-aminobutyrate hydrolase family protein [Candidatus Aminicenantes bacterium]|nr:gamma-glutamyl-gamma-aminobutyrate hydrolase family protein [Candidatus Aminicenantes bacterium]
MKKDMFRRTIVATLSMIVISRAALVAQTPERFFDTAAEPHAVPRLTIFYPSIGTLKALLALKEQGLFPAERFEVVGVYHAKEKTNTKDSQKLVKDQKLTWIKFHQVSAALSVADLYKANAASKEFETIFAKSDGMIFFGGPDIPPATYGQKTSFQTIIEDPWRHFLELSFIFHLLGGSQNDAFKGFLEKRPAFPVLGICLGIQSLNVGTGGTLVQDIWTDVYGQKYAEDVTGLGPPNWHTNPWHKLHPELRELLSYMLHPIRFADRGKFISGLGFKAADQPYIMSAHHQAADRIGKGFKVAATSLDGKIVEAVEHAKFPNVLGVQFHPEFPMLWDAAPKYKFTPEDKELIAINGFLKAHPPSLEFHKKLWTWFFDQVKKP